MTCLFFTVWTRTQRASWRDLSASSKICWLEPLRTIVQASFLLQPENLITLSSPIRISSIESQVPKISSLRSGLSKVERIYAPKAAEILYIPSKSACYITKIPLSTKSCSG